MKLHHFKFNKTWAVMGVALVIGLIAALAARNYLSSQMAAIESRNQGNKVEVVVAKSEMRAGEALTPGSVAVRAIPVEYSHSAALTPADLDRFEGKVLAVSAKPGEIIVWSMLEGKKVPTFSARIENGRRAITVPVDEINSISGMLEPGDVVDLMVSIDQKGKKFTFPLLQTVKVMATGQRAVDDSKSGERRQYSTVTLDVTPEQAQNVIVAREAGKITALLRNPGDKLVFRGGNNDLASMLGLKPESDLQPADPHTGLAVRQVPVLYGGRGAKLPAEGLRMGLHVQSPTVAMPQPTLEVPIDVTTTAPPTATITRLTPDAATARVQPAVASR